MHFAIVDKYFIISSSQYGVSCWKFQVKEYNAMFDSYRRIL